MNTFEEISDFVTELQQKHKKELEEVLDKINSNLKHNEIPAYPPEGLSYALKYVYGDKDENK